MRRPGAGEACLLGRPVPACRSEDGNPPPSSCPSRVLLVSAVGVQATAALAGSR